MWTGLVVQSIYTPQQLWYQSCTLYFYSFRILATVKYPPLHNSKRYDYIDRITLCAEIDIWSLTKPKFTGQGKNSRKLFFCFSLKMFSGARNSFLFLFSISKERRRIEETVDRKQMMSVGFRSFPRSASSITKPAAHPSHIFFLWYAVSTFLFSLCCYIYFDVASSFFVLRSVHFRIFQMWIFKWLHYAAILK